METIGITIFYNFYITWHAPVDKICYRLYTSEKERDTEYEVLKLITGEEITKGQWSNVTYIDLAYYKKFNHIYIFKTKFTPEQEKRLNDYIKAIN